ncbi:MAG: polysaccharide export protein [Acidobacteria bacterium]|jgi:polysaccharide biosynthesis/export protein|nr:polysaccharide export protein [Acidobacteriota bacterium]
MRPRTVALLTLTAALMCPLPSSGQGQVPTKPGSAPTPVAEEATAYHVGRGDVLKVVSYQHDEISGQFPVDEDGNITFPLLDKVHVAGLTTTEIASKLVAALEKDYYVDVQVQVDVSQYQSQAVTIVGEVQRPGTFYLKGPTTLNQLLAEVGGFKSSAGPKVELRRSEVENGASVQKVYTFTTENLAAGKDNDFLLKAGDIIAVEAKQLYFITGEVARPGQYQLEHGMTLVQAITQAGGLGKFASQSVEVHRESAGEKKILDYDLSRIRRGKDPDPQIQPSDVIIIKRRFF